MLCYTLFTSYNCLVAKVRLLSENDRESVDGIGWLPLKMSSRGLGAGESGRQEGKHLVDVSAF